jgi:hypothetical protein
MNSLGALYKSNGVAPLALLNANHHSDTLLCIQEHSRTYACPSL